MSFVYPDVTSTKLLPFKILYGAMKDDPGLLDRPECPYPDDIKSAIKTLFGGQTVSASISKDDAETGSISDEEALAAIPEGSEEFDAVDLRVKKLIVHLDTIASKVGLNDTTEQIAIAKAQSQLFDRLIGMRERLVNLKTMTQYTEVVLDMIERHLSPEQRTSVMAEIAQRLGKDA